MKKLLLLFGFLTLLFAGTATAVAAPQKFIIEFEKSDLNTPSKAKFIEQCVKSGSEYITSTTTLTNVTGGNKDEGIILGTKKGAQGTLKLALAEAAQVAPTKIVINAKKHTGNNSKVKVNGIAASDKLTSSYADYTITYTQTSKITELELSVFKTSTDANEGCRGYIKSVTVFYDDGQSATTPPAKPEISINNAKFNGATYEYYIGKNTPVSVSSIGAEKIYWKSNEQTEYQEVDGNTYDFTVSSDCSYSFYGTNANGNSETAEISFKGIIAPATFKHASQTDVEGTTLTNNDGSTTTTTNQSSDKTTLNGVPQYSTNKNVRLDFIKDKASTWPFAGKSDTRWYVNSKLKISTAPGYALTKIVFTKSEGAFSAEKGTVNNNTWTAPEEGKDISSLMLTCTKKCSLHALMFMSKNPTNQ